MQLSDLLLRLVCSAGAGWRSNGVLSSCVGVGNKHSQEVVEDSATNVASVDHPQHVWGTADTIMSTKRLARTHFGMDRRHVPGCQAR